MEQGLKRSKSRPVSIAEVWGKMAVTCTRVVSRGAERKVHNCKILRLSPWIFGDQLGC